MSNLKRQGLSKKSTANPKQIKLSTQSDSPKANQSSDEDGDSSSDSSSTTNSVSSSQSSPSLLAAIPPVTSSAGSEPGHSASTGQAEEEKCQTDELVLRAVTDDVHALESAFGLNVDQAPPTHCLGIDLGTCNSVVSVYDEKGVRVIKTDSGENIFPSVVHFSGDNRHYGAQAKRNMSSDPFNTINGVKRIIGKLFDDESIRRDLESLRYEIHKDSVDGSCLIKVQSRGESFSPQLISAMILEKLRLDAERAENVEFRYACITVPAYFDANQRRATKAAGLIAGFNFVHLLDEPVAAALVSRVIQGRESTPVVVYDLGGGTFDFSVVEFTGKGELEASINVGDNHIGGDYFNIPIIKDIVDKFQRVHTKKRLFPNDVAKIENAVEVMKKDLMNSNSSEFKFEELGEVKNYKISLSRTQFNRLNAALLDKTMSIIDDGLAKHKPPIKPEEVKEVILVGGSSRIELVQKKLRDKFPGLILDISSDLDESVGKGASIYASIMLGREFGKVIPGLEGYSLQSTTAQSIGLQVALRESTPGVPEGYDRANFGRMDVVIPSGTTFPVEIEAGHTYTNQGVTCSRLNVKVFQGESKWTQENSFLNQYFISGWPTTTGKGQLSVVIKMNLSAESILTITAEEKKSKIKCTFHTRYSDYNCNIEDVKRYRIKLAEMRLKESIAVARSQHEDWVANVIDILEDKDPGHQRFPFLLEVLEKDKDGYEAADSPLYFENLKQSFRNLESAKFFSNEDPHIFD